MTIRWKVLEIEPEAARPIEAARGTVTSETTLFTDGDPLPDSEAENDDVVGYEDIGGLEKQMAMIVRGLAVAMSDGQATHLARVCTCPLRVQHALGSCPRHVR